MDINEHIAYWLAGAEHDWDASVNLFKAGNYDWSLFIAHLVLEKALKALYIQSTNTAVPPKIHNLGKLAEMSNLKLTLEIERFLITANKFNIEARYPDYKNQFYKLCDKEYSQKNLIKIEEIYLWIKSKIQSDKK